jgi:glutamate-1-semialdehyde 2,1-aminomutase
MRPTYSLEHSNSFLARAERVIPLGSQTFSKSRTQYPVGVSPLFAERGEGPYLIDIDGNRYVDYVCSLGAVTLGYCDADVNAAVVDQLNLGTLFSLPSRFETEVAEAIVETVPCAEMVRFGKNGSDATAGAVRLARAFTNRDRIVVCGYHGWQDWYIGTTTRNRGVPEATRSLTHTMTYNKIETLEALFKARPFEIAAVVMEPMSFEEPKPGYLETVKEMCHKFGALLVFDEIVTGFRFSPGTAQELLGVTPDLVTLGKGLANGFPLSAVAGRADVMKLMEEVFFSFTMGGEAISLAAARACFIKRKEHGVLDQIFRVGERLKAGINKLITTSQLTDIVNLSGHPSWTLLTFRDQPGASAAELKTLFMQECFKRGILTIGIHFISYAHSDSEIDQTLSVYQEVFPILRSAVDEGNCRKFLSCEPLVPLFKVR